MVVAAALAYLQYHVVVHTLINLLIRVQKRAEYFVTVYPMTLLHEVNYNTKYCPIRMLKMELINAISHR